MKRYLGVCGFFAVLVAVGCGGTVTGGSGGGGGTGGSGGTTASGNACQKYADTLIAKYTECGIEVTGTGGSTSAECTPDLAVLAACYEACVPKVDCACLKDPTGADCSTKQQPYIDCVTACQ